MPSQLITLQANKPTRQTFGIARYLTIQSLGGAAGVDIDLEVAGFSQESIRNVHERDRISVGETTFEAATFTAPINCTIEIFASMIDLRLNNNEGSGVLSTIVGPLPLPVSINGPAPLPVETSRGGAPATPFFVSGITYSDTPAASNANMAAVAVGPAAAVVAAASATVLRRTFTNIGTQPAAIGAAGITWAARCIVLQPGESFIEDKGAALAWYGITDAGGASSITVMELRA